MFLEEDIKHMIITAYSKLDYKFIENLREYSNNRYFVDSVNCFLEDVLNLCPECFTVLKRSENDRIEETLLVEHLTFHECENCGFGK